MDTRPSCCSNRPATSCARNDHGLQHASYADTCRESCFFSNVFGFSRLCLKVGPDQDTFAHQECQTLQQLVSRLQCTRLYRCKQESIVQPSVQQLGSFNPPFLAWSLSIFVWFFDEHSTKQALKVSLDAVIEQLQGPGFSERHVSCGRWC